MFEFAGDFQTRDINKAQMEMPFPILTPDYIPKGIESPPVFEGTLRRYQINASANLRESASAYAFYSGSVSDDAEDTEIQITYSGVNSYLIIHESRRPMSLGDPEFNPGLRYVDILGAKAIFAEGDDKQGSQAYLSFQRDGLSFTLESANIPNQEVLGIAESMISKELPNIEINNPDTWPWGEAYGRYYTNDITLAQKETGFIIITPTYIPEVFGQDSPYIEGNLANPQTNNVDTIKLLFFSAVSRESSTGTYSWNGGPTQKMQYVVPVILEISEQSVPFSEQSEIATQVSPISVLGREISIWSQDIGDMQYSGATFKQGDIYIDVRCYSLALDEVIKVVESLISQES